MATLIIPPAKAADMKKVRVFSKQDSRYGECTLGALKAARETGNPVQVDFRTTYSKDMNRKLGRSGSSIVKFTDLIV